MEYSYLNQLGAISAIEDGSALAFFQPHVDAAVAALPEELRPYWKPTDAKLLTGRRPDGSSLRSNYKWQVYLQLDYGQNGRTFGTTDITMRKDGSVNTERLSAAVYAITSRRLGTKQSDAARADNTARMDTLPLYTREYVKVTGAKDQFRVTFRHGSLVFERTVDFTEIVPVLSALKEASEKIEAARQLVKQGV